MGGGDGAETRIAVAQAQADLEAWTRLDGLCVDTNEVVADDSLDPFAGRWRAEGPRARLAADNGDAPGDRSSRGRDRLRTPQRLETAALLLPAPRALARSIRATSSTSSCSPARRAALAKAMSWSIDSSCTSGLARSTSAKVAEA